MHMWHVDTWPACFLLPCRCLECIKTTAAPDVGFANFIWACSEWGHRLKCSELEQLVPAAVDHIVQPGPYQAEVAACA